MMSCRSSWMLVHGILPFLGVLGGCGPSRSVAYTAEAFVIAGGQSKAFWAYDAEDDVWIELPDAPGAIGPGGAIAQSQSEVHLYVLRGDATTDFYRFEASTDAWYQLAATPGPVNAGGALTAANWGSDNDLFALQGGGSRSVWRYNVGADQWTTVAETPESIGAGGAIVVLDHGGGLTLDLLAGGRSMAVHSLAVAAGTWSTLGDAPGPVGFGGSITMPHDPRCEFALTGDSNTSFFSTGAACTSPGQLAATPDPVQPGGGVAAAPGHTDALQDRVFGLRGGDTTEFWRYSIADDAWTSLAPTPGPVGEGGGIVQL